MNMYKLKQTIKSESFYNNTDQLFIDLKCTYYTGMAFQRFLQQKLTLQILQI
jgi:hypothetical protein